MKTNNLEVTHILLIEDDEEDVFIFEDMLKDAIHFKYELTHANRMKKGLALINSKSTSEVISRFAYTYDNVGNRLTMTSLDGLTQYAYDDIHQLTNVIYPDGSTTSYNLDPAGNRVSEVVDGNSID